MLAQARCRLFASHGLRLRPRCLVAVVDMRGRRVAGCAPVGQWHVLSVASMSTSPASPSSDGSAASIADQATDAVIPTMDGVRARPPHARLLCSCCVSALPCSLRAGSGIISTAMHAMSYVHDMGLPWWATIAVFSVSLRAAVLPLNIKAVSFTFSSSCALFPVARSHRTVCR